MKILVTGADGFVGSFLTKFFDERGHDVSVCTRNIGAFSPSQDVIIHCAAAAGPWHTTTDIVRDNIDYTNHMLEFCNTKKIIFMSSVSIYGDTSRPFVDENSVAIAPFPYGMSKKLCEDLISESKIPAISLRCPGVVGPNCTGRNWVAELARKIYRGDEITIHSPGSPFNSVVHVEDIAKFIAGSLLQRDLVGHTVMNLAAAMFLPVQFVPLHMAAAMNKKAKLIVDWSKEQRRPLRSQLAESFGWAPMTVHETVTQFAKEFLNEQQT